MRATSEWPEAWGDALTRKDLAPHWAHVQAWTQPGAFKILKLIFELERRETNSPRVRSLALAIVALCGALRPGRTGKGT